MTETRYLLLAGGLAISVGERPGTVTFDRLVNLIVDLLRSECRAQAPAPDADLIASLRAKQGDLKDRVMKFGLMELPGQPQGMHMGTSYLINDLYAAFSHAIEVLAKHGVKP